MEELCGCVSEWRYIPLGKGLEVIAEKSIIMVGPRAFMGYSESVSVVSVGEECRLCYAYMIKK